MAYRWVEPGQVAYSWEEDDFDVPYGHEKMGHTMPNSGQNYVMYHGTTKGNAILISRSGFNQSADGMLGRGVYLSRDLYKASHYPTGVDESQRVVLKVTANVGKVICIHYQGHPRQKNWHDGWYGKVYDTAWCPPDCGMVKSGLEEDCIWDPQRITVINCIAPKPCQPQPAQSFYYQQM